MRRANWLDEVMPHPPEHQCRPLLHQRCPVGWRTIVEHVAVMAAAFGAVVFGARINQLEVGFFSKTPGSVVKNSAIRCRCPNFISLV